MATPNLGITHIAAAQNQKEVTANTAFDLLDLAMTNAVLEDIPDAHFLLPEEDAEANLAFIFAGVITATRGVTLPIKRSYLVSNQTFSSPAVQLIFGTATSPTGRTVALSPMLPGQWALLYCDGFNVDLVAISTAAAAQLGGDLRKITSYVAQSSDAGQLITFDTASAATYTLPAVPFSSTWFVMVKNVNTGAVTVNPSGATMDGRSQNVTLYQGDFIIITTNSVSYFSGAARTLSIGVFAPGVGSNAQVLLYLQMDRPCVFPASAPNSRATANTAATGSTTYTLKKNGVSFATVLFSASGTVGAWTQASDATFGAGDTLEIDGPVTADATLANVGITLQGYRF